MTEPTKFEDIVFGAISDVKKIQFAGKLLDTRDTMRRFYGERFAERCEFYGKFIQTEAEQRGCDLLTATLTIAQRATKAFPDMPMTVALIVAAGVEMIEPSEDAL